MTMTPGVTLTFNCIDCDDKFTHIVSRRGKTKLRCEYCDRKWKNKRIRDARKKLLTAN